MIVSAQSVMCPERGFGSKSHCMWNPFKRIEPEVYQGTTVRSLKGKSAPKGMIYCVVRYKKYVAWHLVKMNGLTENIKADIYATLFQKIKEAYKI